MRYGDAQQFLESKESRPPDAVQRGLYAIRTQPEDFKVYEEALYPVSGKGTHTFLLVEKRKRTTEQVARELARLSGVNARDVGYAGRKDRHAVTRQWYSVPNLDPAVALDFELRQASVVDAARHDHKLRTGHLRANRFEIVLRGEGDSLETVRDRAAALIRRGMPNRFGLQRFGRDGDNPDRARELLRSGRAPRDRRAGRFLVSALQSEVFNAVLDERGERYDIVEIGDLARVEESGGLFWVDDLDREGERASSFEISATGPIFGTKMREPRDRVGQLERQVLDRFEIPAPSALRLPRGIRALGSRRPFRVRPIDLQVEALAGAAGLRVSCALPPGAYITVLLDSLVGEVVDASRVKQFTDADDRAGVS